MPRVSPTSSPGPTSTLRSRHEIEQPDEKTLSAITAAQIQYLEAVATHPYLTIMELAIMLRKAPATVGRALHWLWDKKLIDRKGDPTHVVPPRGMRTKRPHIYWHRAAAFAIAETGLSRKENNAYVKGVIKQAAHLGSPGYTDSWEHDRSVKKFFTDAYIQTYGTPYERRPGSSASPHKVPFRLVDRGIDIHWQADRHCTVYYGGHHQFAPDGILQVERRKRAPDGGHMPDAPLEGVRWAVEIFATDAFNTKKMVTKFGAFFDFLCSRADHHILGILVAWPGAPDLSDSGFRRLHKAISLARPKASQNIPVFVTSTQLIVDCQPLSAIWAPLPILDSNLKPMAFKFASPADDRWFRPLPEPDRKAGMYRNHSVPERYLNAYRNQHPLGSET